MAELSITFLGTGTSQGVPFVACECEVCSSSDPRDKRLRSSILLETPQIRVLVDTTPDLRAQALRQKLHHLDATIFTHSHTDHIAGFDDLRRFCELSDRPMPIYASPRTMSDLRRMFYYAFDGNHVYRNYVRPEPREFNGTFQIADLEITPAEVPHGNMPAHGFIFSRSNKKLAAYFPDCNAMPEAVADSIRDIPVLIIDALRHKPHPTHLSLSQAVAIANDVDAKQTYLTHIGHDLGHVETENILPENIRIAHDGLRIEI